MVYGSVCSGLEAATVAWHPLGWVPAWFSEIEPFPCSVLKYHYPHIPNLGDMTKLLEDETFKQIAINLLVGGTPCQSFSIAGLRGGLSDQRGNLALQFCRLLIAKQPRWFVWENVPGALTSFSDETDDSEAERFIQTSDFAAILSAFRECGYSCAYRILDAQYFGVPQRRRRVFVVGYFGNDWRPPATVLFDGESSTGDFKPRRKAGEEVAPTLTSRTKGGGFGGHPNEVVATLTASMGRTRGAGIESGHTVVAPLTGRAYADRGSEFTNLVMATGQPNAEITVDLCSTLNCNHENPILIQPFCYETNQISSPLNRSNPQPGDPVPTLTRKGGAPLLMPVVRRLTPLECERLQGFPDYYTKVPGCNDTARYRAVGNSMAVPVMHWIGNRINIVDNLLNSKK